MEKLLSLDQLNIHRKEGKVFIGFYETAINFKPSYKFDPFTEIYDTGRFIIYTYTHTFEGRKSHTA
jgi:hypothetical protein